MASTDHCNENIIAFLDSDHLVTLCSSGVAWTHFSLIPAIWWFILSLCSISNIYQAFHIFFDKKDEKRSPSQLRYCAAIYIFACAVRSIWPRRDVERICFFDTWVSFPIVGRTLATIAELCFAHQIAVVLGAIAIQLNSLKISKILKLVVPIIAIAQTCCWMGVSTQRQLWHGIEESIWMIIIQICGIFALYLSLILNNEKNINNSPERLLTKYKLIGSFVLSILFTLFMFFVDVPMYIDRYYADEKMGKVYLSVIDGILDSASCHMISKHMNEWEPEIPWLTGYFVGATYLSLKLTTIPNLGNNKNKKKGN